MVLICYKTTYICYSLDFLIKKKELHSIRTKNFHYNINEKNDTYNS